MKRLFAPKSIAVIGGGAWGAAVINKAREGGFDGPIWPVHPKADIIAGEKVYPSLDALPDAPDASYICVNRHITVEVVRELSKMNAGGAICFASGFAEAISEDENAANLQAELVDAAGEMPILGPNCYGFANYLDDVVLWPDEHGGTHVDTGVAILTQSSNIAINMSMQKRGLPIAMMLTVGNQAQTTMAELARQLIKDKRITALGLHIEGFGDLREWEALAQEAHKANIPIVAIKVGQSEQAQIATQSHTASLAGNHAGAVALLKRLGIAQVNDIGVFLETLKIFHGLGALPNSDIATMSCSGGEASILADIGAEIGINFPALIDQQSKALREALGPMVALANPLDYHTYIWRDLEAMTRTYAAMVTPDLGLTCVVIDIPRDDRCNAKDWADVIPCTAAAAKQTGGRMAVLASLAETMPEDMAQACFAQGIVPLCGFYDALCAIKAAASVGAPDQTPILLGDAPNDVDLLSEAEAKSALGKYGVQSPKSVSVDGIKNIANACEGLAFPVVVKGVGLAHKSEAGAVALGIMDAGGAHDAAQKMPCDQFLIEEMITDQVAEILIGVTQDPAHGFVLTIGAGGIMTEILRDTAHLILPANRDDIRAALMSLKIAPLLNGFRGKPAANIEEIINAIDALQRYVHDHSDTVTEAEINPLIATKDGAIAVDALIRKAKT